jgi:hypothetical protein
VTLEAADARGAAPSASNCGRRSKLLLAVTAGIDGTSRISKKESYRRRCHRSQFQRDAQVGMSRE